MDVNQCSYCGVSVFMEGDICPSCQAAMGYQSESAPETTAENPFETHEFATNNEPVQQSFESPNFPEPLLQANFLPETNLPTQPMRSSTADWKRCPICNAGIAQYRDICSRCETVKPVSQKSGFGKFVFIFLLVGLFGGGIYYYINSSIPPILRKFSQATGSNGTIAADSFVMKGSAKVAIQQVMSASAVAFGGRAPVRKEEAYLFEFSHKSPDKSLMDFYKMNGSSRESAISQGFNGTSGWKYTNIFNQPAKLENTGNGFSEGNIGLGVTNSQDISELDEATKAEFANAMSYFKDLLKTFEVEGNTKTSNSKAFLVSKKTNGDGKPEKTLLVFDEESGFMIGMAKFEMLDNKPISTIGFFDKYKKFWLKEKGLFGSKNKFVSIPTAWTFKIGELEMFSGTVGFTVNMSLEIDSITMDVPLNEAIFEKPVK